MLLCGFRGKRPKADAERLSRKRKLGMHPHIHSQGVGISIAEERLTNKEENNEPLLSEQRDLQALRRVCRP